MVSKNFKAIFSIAALSRWMMAVFSISLFFFTEITTYSHADVSKAQSETVEEEPQSTLPPVAIGDPEAPLKIVMYHSLNCIHCKIFKDEELPKIKEKFIDNGLVYFTFVDCPIDPSALDAAKIAWESRDVEKYETVSGVLTTNYDKWAGQPDWQKHLCQIVTENQLMTEVQCEQGLNDEALGKEILRIAFHAQKKYKIDYAPAFLLNGKLKQTEALLSCDDIENELKQIQDPKTSASHKDKTVWSRVTGAFKNLGK